jgi:hypothetical protein
MGWTETNWRKGTKIKDWFVEGYNQETDKIKQTVLDTALVARSEAYAAIETINKVTGERTVSMIVVIVKFQNGGYYNFRYKDMHETCGPYIYRCPKSLMILLTPTDNKNALEWRQRVNEYWAQKDKSNKKMKKLNIGDTIVFTKPLRFSNGTSYKSLQVLSLKPFRLTDGSVNIFGIKTTYSISRRTLDKIIDQVIPAGQGQVEREIEEVTKDNKHKYPVYYNKDMKKDYTCILWAQGKNGWEWYGFELDDKENKIYFGYVMGFENEWGYFSLQELLDAGVTVVTDPNDLQKLAPPIGGNWISK